MLKFLFSPKGRIGRVPFAAFVIPPIVVFGVVEWFAAVTIGPTHEDYSTLLFILSLLKLLFLWPSFVLTVKRLHDVNRSWHPAILWFSPVLVAILFFISSSVILAESQPDMETLLTVGGYITTFGQILLYLKLALVVVLTFVPGTKGPNRYDAAAPKDSTFD